MNSKGYLIARLALGGLFLLFGSNGLMMVLTGAGFIPMPEPPEHVAAQMGALFSIGYLMPMVKSLQILSGLLLLTNRFVNLALVLLGPIIVNILCVHLFIDLSGLPIAIFVMILFLVLLKYRWSDFKGLVKA